MPALTPPAPAQRPSAFPTSPTSRARPILSSPSAPLPARWWFRLPPPRCPTAPPSISTSTPMPSRPWRCSTPRRPSSPASRGSRSKKSSRFCSRTPTTTFASACRWNLRSPRATAISRAKAPSGSPRTVRVLPAPVSPWATALPTSSPPPCPTTPLWRPSPSRPLPARASRSPSVSSRAMPRPTPSGRPWPSPWSCRSWTRGAGRSSAIRSPLKSSAAAAFSTTARLR